MQLEHFKLNNRGFPLRRSASPERFGMETIEFQKGRWVMPCVNLKNTILNWNPKQIFCQCSLGGCKQISPRIASILHELASPCAQLFVCWVRLRRQMRLNWNRAKVFLSTCRNSSFVARLDRIKNSWSDSHGASSEAVIWSINECRDGAWRRGLGAIWGTDCWNGCSHWCKVHPLVWTCARFSIQPVTYPANFHTRVLQFQNI